MYLNLIVEALNGLRIGMDLSNDVTEHRVSLGMGADRFICGLASQYLVIHTQVLIFILNSTFVTLALHKCHLYLKVCLLMFLDVGSHALEKGLAKCGPPRRRFFDIIN